MENWWELEGDWEETRRTGENWGELKENWKGKRGTEGELKVNCGELEENWWRTGGDWRGIGGKRRALGRTGGN